MPMLILAALALAGWIGALLAPWRAWSCREHLEPAPDAPIDAGAVTILLPARNETVAIGKTLAALAAAAPGARVILIDDQSTDATVAIACASGLARLDIIAGTPPPAGWTGKLWALQQGLDRVATPQVLLLDADIALARGLLAALQRKLADGNALVSVLAEPDWGGWPARWLMPAYVFFFKLLYPFALANRAHSRIAAAAGGVALVERAALAAVGGFAAWRGAIIDDCTLARHLKHAGFRCWIGLSHGAASQRGAGLRDIAHMIARTAFVQLRESVGLTAAAAALLIVAFWIPVLALAFGSDAATRSVGALAWLALAGAYLPTLTYYRRNPLAALLLPAAATFYLGAMVYSTLRALGGTRSVWKGRRYPQRSA